MKCGGIALENEDVYMATEFDAFVKKVVMVGRGITGKKEFSYKAVSFTDHSCTKKLFL